MEATEELEGLQERICSVCGYKESQSIDKLPHNHKYNELHYDDSNHWKECSCGKKSELEEHNWNSGIITLEPTEDTEGITTFTCNVCSDTKVEKIDKLSYSIGLSYDIIDEKAIVVNVGRCKNNKTIIISSEYEGYPVTEIYVNAFQHCSNLTNIEIPSIQCNKYW